MDLTVKYRYRVQGGHTHVRVFAGTTPDALGLTGTTIWRNEEWELFMRLQRLVTTPEQTTYFDNGDKISVRFVDDTDEPAMFRPALPLDAP